jgi:L-seryl-tRNA(Ser) seleniumtransferase
MRVDKAVLAGIAATLALYRAGRALTEVPVWRTIALPAEELRVRAEWIQGLAGAAGRSDVEALPLESPVGGGSLPGQVIPSWGVSVPVRSPARAAAALRAGPDRILARIVDDAIVFDLRTVPRFHDGTLVRRIGELPAPRP